MKATLTIDNVPNEESRRLIHEAIRNRRMSLMDLCKIGNITDRYVQFRAWINGVPNQKNTGAFIKALKTADIVEEVQRYRY